jgi:hypothetical protein
MWPIYPSRWAARSVCRRDGAPHCKNATADHCRIDDEFGQHQAFLERALVGDALNLGEFLINVSDVCLQLAEQRVDSPIATLVISY